MTSLKILPPLERAQGLPVEWGTGNTKHSDIWLPKGPTWHTRDVPIQQYYDLTQLKRSNIRLNDQLVPRPQDIAFQDSMINKSYPAEHPYSSHTPRNAVFPKFAESPEDPKRGVDAKGNLPKDHEVPSNPYDVIVVSKTKGSGMRKEIVRLVPESLKKGLSWPGDQGFDQKVKTHGGQQQYYPSPPKTLVPNLEKRPPSQQIAPKTANTLRNIERGQWQTTYDLNHTGLGPSNALSLDNFDEKVLKLNQTGEIDDNLYPRSLRTYDPPQPIEGRIARQLVPPPPSQVIHEQNQQATPRKMTHRELEEHRLLNGRDYVSLPEGADSPGSKHEHERWRAMGEAFHSDTGLQALAETKARAGEPDENPMKQVGPPGGKDKSYLEEMKDAQKERFQQVEAGNRWKLLEAATPNHDIETLNHKYKIVHEKEKPKVFYEHEGKYNEERAGLYKTSYLPERLTNSMTELERSGPEIMNTMNSHVDAINYPTRLNSGMDAALASSKYIQSSRNGLYVSGKLSPTEVLEPHYRQEAEQRKQLHQSPRTARVNVVEKNLINTESEHGRNYNHPKYLQEDEIDPEARQESLMVMSQANQNLGNVRPYAAQRRGGKTVQFADNLTVATGAGAEPIRIRSAPMGLSVPNPGVNVADTQYQSTEAQYDWRNSSLVQPRGDQGQGYMEDVKKNAFSFASSKSNHEGKKTITFGVATKRRGTYDDDRDQFASNSTTFFPGKVLDGASEQFNTAYQAQFPHYNIDYKNDARFQWKGDSNTPRPQTSLLQIQNSFTKSDAHKKLHHVFPETNVDLRENIIDGRQHVFDSFGHLNAQQLRGHCT
ncbi:uncharacterized protein LOC135498467 isoform X2 [Lineus longissimus]|uniref:uncharacterized protein LOC135498467 isoform X2 n=1 Tax=Lineus longissimus TaxID=88925 RepID=UPI00315DC2CD